MFNLFKEKNKKKEEEQVETMEPKVIRTEQDLMLEFAACFGDIGEYDTDSEEEQRMFEELKGVDYFQTYLRAQIAKDMQQYFAATTDQQRDLIKGRIARTSYLRSHLLDRKDQVVSTTKMKGLRYGARST